MRVTVVMLVLLLASACHESVRATEFGSSGQPRAEVAPQATVLEEPPTQPAPPPLVQPMTIPQVVALQATACALSPATHLWCWGRVVANQSLFHPSPTRMSWGDDVMRVATDGAVLCGLRRDGSMKCTRELAEDPGQFATWRPETGEISLPAPAIDLVGGDGYFCVHLVDQRVACMGYLGDGENESCASRDGEGAACHRSMHLVPGIEGARAISAGSQHACAITAEARVACWGANEAAQLGSVEAPSHAAPSIISGVENATAVAAGNGWSAAVAEGRVFAWGARRTRSDVDASTHALVRTEIPELSGAGALFGSNLTLCAWSSTALRCVTRPTGPPPTPPRPRRGARAVRVPIGSINDSPFELVVEHGASAAIAQSFACFGRDDGSVACRGDNQDWQLGNPWVWRSDTLMNVLDAAGSAVPLGEYFAQPLDPIDADPSRGYFPTLEFEPIALGELTTARFPPTSAQASSTVRAALAYRADELRECLASSADPHEVTVDVALESGSNRALRGTSTAESPTVRECLSHALVDSPWPRLANPTLARFTLTR